MQKLGIDFCGHTRRIAQVDDSSGVVAVTGLHRTSAEAPIAELSQISLPVTIAIPDDQAIVRMVQTADVDSAMAESAARFEAATALVSRDSAVRTTVERIVLPGFPGRWLTSSVHESVLEQLTHRALADDSRPNTISFITRSVALGRGYLRVCETSESPNAVVIHAGEDSTAICFVCHGRIVGTAQLRADPGNGECARWISELQMVVNYRLGSDLALFYGDAGPLQVMAAEVETVNRMNALSSVIFAPVTIKSHLAAGSDGATPLTPEWLIPIGAAFN